jgi:hypothetical protein
MINYIFLENCAVYEIMWKHGAARQVTDDYMAQALSVLDNKRHRHTLVPFPPHNVRANVAQYYDIGTLSDCLFNPSMTGVLIYICFHFSVPMPYSY